jgi:hypothetical protein
MNTLQSLVLSLLGPEVRVQLLIEPPYTKDRKERLSAKQDLHIQQPSISFLSSIQDRRACRSLDL